jgi:hypothetical protein
MGMLRCVICSSIRSSCSNPNKSRVPSWTSVAILRLTRNCGHRVVRLSRYHNGHVESSSISSQGVAKSLSSLRTPHRRWIPSSTALNTAQENHPPITTLINQNIRTKTGQSRHQGVKDGRNENMLSGCACKSSNNSCVPPERTEAAVLSGTSITYCAGLADYSWSCRV